jgi:group II intron reverse transcriptase/maturase
MTDLDTELLEEQYACGEGDRRDAYLRNIDGAPPPIGTPIGYNDHIKNIYDLVTSRLKWDEEGKCLNAFDLFSDPTMLKAAYESIKSKAGNMVKGTDTETLDGISIKWFDRTSRSLREQTFRFRPSRRVPIPKPGGGVRYLGIGSPRDKLIQQAMRLVMEHILEPKFLDCSTGFRPKRGCHTALKKVRNWTQVYWYLEGDIKKFFDSIDHQLLEGLLKKHFQDPKLIDLYWNLVEAGYIEWNEIKNTKDFIESRIGVPQGGILSPLLSNLILHEFDEFIMQLIECRVRENGKEPPLLNNNKYNRLTHRISTLRTELVGRKYKEEKETYKNLRREMRKLIHQRNGEMRQTHNPRHIKVNYVRYADDWLIGVRGPYSYVKELKRQARDFLSTIKLELSQEKTLITSALRQTAKFLGTIIKVTGPQEGGLNIRGGGKRKTKMPWGKTWMTAPTLNIRDRLTSNLYLIKEEGKWRISFPKLFLTLPVRDMIIRYRSILKGYTNYFSFADNIHAMRWIHHLLQESLKKLIRNKMDLNIWEFKKKFGTDISLNILKRDGTKVILDFKLPVLRRTPDGFLTTTLRNPLKAKSWKIHSINALGQGCANCGIVRRVEMHHVKHIKTINPRLSPFDQALARINRKQVPLCRACHLKVHLGTYKGASIRNYYFFPFLGEAKWR